MNPGQPQGQPPGWGAPPQQQGYGQQPSPPANPQWAAAQNPYPQEDIESGKMLALLGYLISPLWILPLVQRDNTFALFHAKQAMVYTIFMALLGTVIGIVTTITCGFGAVLAFGIFPFMYPWVMGIIYAAQGEYRYMPWIGHYAHQYFSGIVADKRPLQRPPGY